MAAARLRLSAGDPAPGFQLPDQDGDIVSMQDFRGRPLVVYFYPADNTPGCTIEARQFDGELDHFSQAGADVVGISPDGSESHQAFRGQWGLRLRLLSDPDHAVAEAWGAWGERTLYGRKVVGIIRSTFVVDGGGVVARAWYNVRADGHASRVLAALGS